jgi:large-conductance mechanosensitive channel
MDSNPFVKLTQFFLGFLNWWLLIPMAIFIIIKVGLEKEEFDRKSKEEADSKKEPVKPI